MSASTREILNSVPRCTAQWLLPGSTWITAWIATLAIGAGIALRLWRIKIDGMVDTDSGYYIIFANYYREIILHHSPHYFGLDTQAKPGFMLLAFFTSLVFGLEGYSLPALNAVLAGGIGFIIYRIAQLVFRSATVSASALILAMFVPFLIDLDRKGLAHGAVTLAILLSIYMLLKWSTYPWVLRRGSLIGSGLALGVAFLCHPTVFFYVVTLGAIVLAISLSVTKPTLREKAMPAFVFFAAAAAPVLFAELFYRVVFLVWPELIGLRNPAYARFFGFGYIGDLLNHFHSAEVYKANVKALGTVAGDGAEDPAFFINTLRMFRVDAIGVVYAVGVTCSSVYLIWRYWAERRVQYIVMLAVAYTPLLMMAFNPFFGQFARSLHATLPLFMLVLAVGMADLMQYAAANASLPRAYASAVTITLTILFAADGARAFVGDYHKAINAPNYLANSARLPDLIFTDLAERGIIKVYLYQNVFGLQWWYYLKKHYNALPSALENPNARPVPEVRVISDPDDLERMVKAGKVEAVILLIRPRADGAPFLDETERKQAEQFPELVTRLGGREIMNDKTSPIYSKWVRVFEFSRVAGRP